MRPIDRNGWKMRFWEESACRFRYCTALDPDRLVHLEREPHRIARYPTGSRVSDRRRKVNGDK